VAQEVAANHNRSGKNPDIVADIVEKQKKTVEVTYHHKSGGR
jgi:hypothetical protein